jgi:Circadian oscillating protein COP23
MLKFTILTLGLIALSFNLLLEKGAIAQVPIETDSNNPVNPTTTIPNRSPSNSRDPKDIVITRPPSPNTGATSTGTISNQRFSCQSQSGQYTVMYQPKSQQGQFYAWSVPSVMGGGWSSQRRCNEISRRLEQYRPDGLVEMQIGIENGYNVICVTTDKNPACRIVLTVPVGADPNNIRDRVFANITTADSGQSTVGVNTFVEGNRSNSLNSILGISSGTSKGTPRSSFRNNAIDLKPFLDSADGGTATELRTSGSKGLKLSPNRF